MNAGNSVMVFIEQIDGKIAPICNELICEGVKLAAVLKTDVCAVVVGHNLNHGLEELGWYGCSAVYKVEDARLSHFTSLPYSKAVTAVVKKHRPRIVLFGATSLGRDLAPRVASALRCGLTADCTGLQIGNYQSRGIKYEDVLLQIRPAFGGNVIATIASPESRPSMATVREGVMRLEAPDRSRKARVMEESVSFTEDDFITEVLEVTRKTKEVNLLAANVIVAAGMGAGNPDSLALVKELAQLLRAELGASRAVVDSGLLSKDHQVGQTGTTVRPNLYIACGISGQIQHRAGMGESKRIVAINSDPEAPIFQIAHYGIVGDLNEVVPRMIRAYKEKV